MKNKRFLILIGLSLSLVGISCFLSSPVIDLKKHYLRIPVRFFPFLNVPLINVEIEGCKYSLLVDLGSSNHIDLKKQYIDKIKNKEFVDNFRTLDMKGNGYLMPGYKVAGAKIQNILEMNGVMVHEENMDFLTFGARMWPIEGIVSKFKKKLDLFTTDGRIGWTVFKKMDCLFDFPRSTLLVAEDMSFILNESGYAFDEFVKVPFSLENFGVVLSLETDLGLKRFFLDTGATHSVLRSSQVDKKDAEEIAPNIWTYTSSHLLYEGQDFGNSEFVLYDYSDWIESDGILGIDFFNKYAIALDFHNQVAYIQQPGKGPGTWERFSCWFRGAFCF